MHRKDQFSQRGEGMYNKERRASHVTLSDAYADILTLFLQCIKVSIWRRIAIVFMKKKIKLQCFHQNCPSTITSLQSRVIVMNILPRPFFLHTRKSIYLNYLFQGKLTSFKTKLNEQ